MKLGDIDPAVCVDCGRHPTRCLGHHAAHLDPTPPPLIRLRLRARSARRSARWATARALRRAADLLDPPRAQPAGNVHRLPFARYVAGGQIIVQDPRPPDPDADRAAGMVVGYAQGLRDGRRR